MTNIPNDQFAPSTRSRVRENHAGGGWAALVTRHLRRVFLKKIRHWSLAYIRVHLCQSVVKPLLFACVRDAARAVRVLPRHTRRGRVNYRHERDSGYSCAEGLERSRIGSAAGRRLHARGCKRRLGYESEE